MQNSKFLFNLLIQGHSKLFDGGVAQWRSQSAADARAQHGHTKFASSLVPRLRPASPLAVRKCRSNQGGVGVLSQKILEFLSFLG